MEFNKGDRIVVTKKFTRDAVTFYEGQTGTYIGTKDYGDNLGIKWDFDNPEFHYLTNRINSKRGYWIYPGCIKKFNPKKNNLEGWN